MSSEGFHEPLDRLAESTLDHHRAISSAMEELEAIDWYEQRVDATGDAELAAVLAHNRDEEKEHFAMTLEWMRRRDPKLDEVLHTYLFTDGSITGLEHAAEAAGGSAGSAGAHASAASAGSVPGSLGVGSLRGEGLL